MKFLRTNLIGLLCVSAPLGVLLAFLFVLALPGCSTAPTQAQQTTATIVISAAVAVAVQNGAQNPAVWASRAKQIQTIAKQLQGVAVGDTATLPALTAALQPMLAKLALAPPDQLAANALIAALSQIIQQNANKLDANASQIIARVLDDVIVAASVYVPNSP